MKRTITFVLGPIGPVALVLLVCSSSALCQQKCQDFRALYHQTLWVDLVSGAGDWYTDPDAIRGLLDLQPVTPVSVQYIPGKSGGGNGVSGRYADYQKRWDITADDGFLVGDFHAIFPTPPGNAGMGTFMGSGKIIEGWGMFKGATGTEFENGPYMTWMSQGEIGGPCTDSATCLTGKYFATISIRVCTK